MDQIDALIQDLRELSEEMEELTARVHNQRKKMISLDVKTEMLLKDAKRIRDRLGSEWIPCSERLPKHERAVLVYERENKNIYTAINIDGRWESFDVHDPVWMDETAYGDIVAWMPLPAPYDPKNGGES